MNITPIEAMKQALEALEDATVHIDSRTRAYEYEKSADNLRAAIEQMEKAEPIGTVVIREDHSNYSRNPRYVCGVDLDVDLPDGTKLYLHPAPTIPEGVQLEKAEALQVLTQWDEMWERLGKPGVLGETKIKAVEDMITQLRQRIWELECEKSMISEVMADMEKQLLESQAREANLRKFLSRIPECEWWEDARGISKEALALPYDDTALKEYRKQVLLDAAKKMNHYEGREFLRYLAEGSQ